jgi:hypothetical protein
VRYVRAYSARLKMNSEMITDKWMFYKTCCGAHVGDIFMSLIYRCELCEASSFDYLIFATRYRLPTRISLTYTLRRPPEAAFQ